MWSYIDSTSGQVGNATFVPFIDFLMLFIIADEFCRIQKFIREAWCKYDVACTLPNIGQCTDISDTANELTQTKSERVGCFKHSRNHTFH